MGFQAKLLPHDRSQAVAITSTLILGPNAKREWVTFVVEGANKVNLQLGAAAAVNTGIPLLGSGGAFVMDMRTLPWYGAVYAIATTAPSQLSCVEVEREV